MNRVSILTAASILVLLSACAVQPTPFTADDLKAQAKADQAQIDKTEPVTHPLTLSEAIARALKYNLDHRTKMMEQALALGQTELDRWDLLPKLTANAGYAGRSAPYASTSRNLYSQTPNDAAPTYSEDRDVLTNDLTLSWNVLDFGVSYFNAHQNANRVLIAEERRRKTVHNLVQEVRYAFWNAAAAQALDADVKNAIKLSEQALNDAQKVEDARLKNPIDILRFQKGLLENQRQLESVSQELSSAHIELAALIGLPPATPFTLEIPPDSEMVPPSISMDVEKMEETALVNNADLREQGYNARIAADETRKTILKMLPGISLSTGRDWNSNSFLANNMWYEAGARVSWNLVNLLSAPDQIATAEAGEAVAEARRQALHMAVLAQVHISLSQFANTSRQYTRSVQLYRVEQRLAAINATRTQNDAQSVMDDIASKTGLIAAELRRYQSYAQMQASLGRLYASMGLDFLPGAAAGTDLKELSREVSHNLQAWSRGVPEDALPKESSASTDGKTDAASQALPAQAQPAASEDGNDTGLVALLSQFGDWLANGQAVARNEP